MIVLPRAVSHHRNVLCLFLDCEMRGNVGAVRTLIRALPESVLPLRRLFDDEQGLRRL
jgi:hypothetical protein